MSTIMELVATAFDCAVQSKIAGLEAAKTDGELESALAVYLDEYLTIKHVNNLRTGCPFASLGTDADRSPDIIATAMDAGFERWVKALRRALPPGHRDETTATTVLSILLGSLVLARMTQDPASQSSVLASGKRQISQILSGHTAETQ